jgi:ubiquinone/menaquinone biosynthesis C-methylase UbiE
VSALAELRRILKPGGQLRFYEHVRPKNPRVARWWQRADDSGIDPRLAGGCHAARDTETAIRTAGFPPMCAGCAGWPPRRAGVRSI